MSRALSLFLALALVPVACDGQLAGGDDLDDLADDVLLGGDGRTTYSVGIGETQIAALEDAKVRSTSPDRNYGSDPTLRVREASTSYRALLKFKVSGLVAPVASAKVALFVLDGSPDGGTLHATGSAWSEGAITWRTAPALGASLAAAGPVTTGTWVTFDVSSTITANGTYAFALRSASTNSAYYSSREGTRAPLLVIRSSGSSTDAGAPRGDSASSPRADAGPAPSTDSGAGPSPDAGAPKPEAGAPKPDAGAPPPVTGAGIWISPQELALRPTSGAAWQAVQKAAASACGTPDLANQDDPTNVCVLAKALVHARTGQASYLTDVKAALSSIASSGTYSGRALALGRELGTYVVAADLIKLKSVDPVLDGQFRARIKALLTTLTTSGPASLIECHEDRPNNWGTHCGASRVAVAAYLGDKAELDKAAQVFRGWLGDRAAYAGFSYGDLSWQCDASKPVGVNPKGCTKSGHSLDGVLPDDQRRAGSFTWPPPKENYVYEALQGALMQAVILERAGYGVLAAQDKALLRAFSWLLQQASFPAEGDDTWEPHLINRFYGTSFPAPVPSSPGKNMGFTDWTHGA